MVSPSVLIRRAEAADSRAIATMHCHQIPWGLLSQCGEEFVTAFYDALIRSPLGFGLVAEQDGHLVGFTMGVVNWRRFYREFLRRHLRMAAAVVLSSLSGGRWRRFLDTSRYATSGDLPPAELISIALEAEARGTGVGAELVRRLLDEFAARDVEAVRVTAGGSNLKAQQLYERIGFRLRSNMEIHPGETAAVYVIKLGPVQVA